MYLMMWSVALLAGRTTRSSTTTSSARSPWSVLGLTLAGDTWGLGKAWARQHLVAEQPGPAVTAPTHSERTPRQTARCPLGDTPLPYSVSGATGPLGPDELALTDAWWRAANYLAVGQIYLLANPLLTRAAAARARQAPAARPLRHRAGPQPRARARQPADPQARDLDAVFVAGPGHGGPGPNACAWLEGTYSELYSHIPQDAEGMARASSGSSPSPAACPSHCAPETPGSFHEGGELGYSLLHAYGAVLDNPDLVAFCVVGDGEAETGPLATSWHCNTFVDPARDGAVLPILHLNGYKIANPTLLARIPEERAARADARLRLRPARRRRRRPRPRCTRRWPRRMDTCLDDIAAIQTAARAGDGARSTGGGR